MPTLNWIGKDKVINHHMDVPYKILEHSYGYSDGKQVNFLLPNSIVPLVRYLWYYGLYLLLFILLE